MLLIVRADNNSVQEIKIFKTDQNQILYNWLDTN